MKVTSQLIVVAGGLGKRLGRAEPKALVPLGDTPLLCRTLAAFDSFGLTDEAIVVYPEGHESSFQTALDAAFPGKTIHLVPGGAERSDSVWLGLEALSSVTELVVIHDAARPFIGAETIRAVVAAATDFGAATVATRCKDTILQSDETGLLDATPDRSLLWACQTPQVFRRAIIESAYATSRDSTTDDATLVHRGGVPVQIVEGPDTNLKITTEQDLHYAAFLLLKGLV